MGHSHGHGHGHSHSHGIDGHRECSTPPPPPGTVDLEEMMRKSEAEQRRKAELAKANSDQGNGISPISEITAQNLEADVLLRSEEVPVVVAIGGAAAPESVRLRTELERMVRAAGLTWMFAWVDADTQPQVARAFGVQDLPTVIAVAMGSPIGMFVGEKSHDWLKQWIDQVLQATAGKLKGLPAGTRMADSDGEGSGVNVEEATDFFGNPVPTEDPRLEAAESLLAEGDFDAALELYDVLLKSEPANSGLKRARANVAFFARAAKIDRTADPIARADADPNNIALAMDAADVIMLVDDPAKALERLLDLLPQVTGDERTQIKDRLLDLLQLFDAADPIALDARRRLSAALF